jgi:hypothetical protein
MASLDALFSLMPILILLVFVMNLEAMLVKWSEDASHRQQVFDKLASAADYTVKVGVVRREGDTRYPNWVDEKNLTETYTNSLRERVGLSALHVCFGGPSDDSQICVYRLVVVGDDKAITRLFFCGG